MESETIAAQLRNALSPHYGLPSMLIGLNEYKKEGNHYQTSQLWQLVLDCAKVAQQKEADIDHLLTQVDEKIQLDQQIELVKGEILRRYPGGHYTIIITLWDDGTNMVVARHGNKEGKLCLATHYNHTLTYEEIEVKKGAKMLVDEEGTEYFSR